MQTLNSASGSGDVGRRLARSVRHVAVPIANVLSNSDALRATAVAVGNSFKRTALANTAEVVHLSRSGFVSDERICIIRLVRMQNCVICGTIPGADIVSIACSCACRYEIAQVLAGGCGCGGLNSWANNGKESVLNIV